MYYKNIYIRDFGIFRNQNLKDISKKLVVIGGKNRAGKSTFFKLLRYLPFGLPQNNSIPPANNQYYIEAELEKENMDYNLFLNGFSKPEVIDTEHNQYTAAELFNHLDQLTYQQLFSISLDELKHLSKIAKGKKKEKRLFSILLGAGFSELVKVPEIADKYFNNAKNIGGILGDPSVAEFKPYYNQIKTAEEMRDQALLEIKEFSSKREELKQNRKKLEMKKQKIDELETRYFLLDLLKNNYSELEELEKLKLKLKKTAVGADNPNIDILEQKKTLDDFLEYIKTYGKKIERYQQKEQLLRERIKNYQAEKDKIASNLKILISELGSLNSNWQEPLKELEYIDADLIQTQKLNDLLAEYEQLESEIDKIKIEIRNLKLKIDENNSKLNKLNFKKPEKVLKQSYLIIAFSVITLSTSFFIDFNQLRYFSLILALIAFVYYSSNYKNSSLKDEKKDEIKSENQRQIKQLEEKESELSQKQKKLNKTRTALDKYAQILGIAENDYLKFIDSYFREIRDKKRRYKQLKIEESENKERASKLEKELKSLQDLITNAAQHCSLDLSSVLKQNLIENYQPLFEDFNLLNNLFGLSKNYLSIKSQLEHTLKASDKIKTALNKNKKDEIHNFIQLGSEFSSLAAVEEKKNILAEQLNKLKQEKDDLDEKITTLKNKINSLATSSKIESAQRKIDQARNNLEKKARNYAVNKSVSFILKKLRSRMIEKTEKELLNPASKILEKISNHHYTDLKTTADLEQSDFRLTTKNGDEFNSVQQLSRGSLEQLFLAVRISRIKEIDPPLPLVLDDSLVNFDRVHLYNTAELISNLASRHQIFILSCHPHLISYISKITKSAQYWKLESGKFELSNPQDLITHLNY